MSTATKLLAEIEAFCARHGISETTFGRAVARDGHLVRRLRRHKSMTIRRMDRCRAFMAAEDARARPAGGKAKPSEAAA